MVDDRRPADVGAVRVDKHVRPLLEAELDAGVIVIVVLEAGPHRCEGVDEGHLEGLREVGHHVDAIDLGHHDLVLEQVLQDHMLSAGVVVLGRELAVGDTLDRVGKYLAKDILRASLGEVLGLATPHRPLVNGLVLGKQAIELMVVRAPCHLHLCRIIARMHLRDVLGGKL